MVPHLTHHATRQGRSRAGLTPYALEKVAARAWEKAERPPKNWIIPYINGRGYKYRRYGTHVFVFGRRKGFIALITVFGPYPSKLFKVT